MAANPVLMLNLVSLFPMGGISPEGVAQAVEPAQVEEHLAFFSSDLLGGVINTFNSGVPRLTALAWRSSIFNWQCWKSNSYFPGAKASSLPLPGAWKKNREWG